MTLAILLSAWWGGLWAGIYATFLGAALGNLLVAPAGSFAMNMPSKIVLLSLFLFIGTAMSILTDSMQSDQQVVAEASAAAARRNWESLLESDQRAHSIATQVEWRDRFDAWSSEPSRPSISGTGGQANCILARGSTRVGYAGDELPHDIKQYAKRSSIPTNARWSKRIPPRPDDEIHRKHSNIEFAIATATTFQSKSGASPC